jgi:transaldolase
VTSRRAVFLDRDGVLNAAHVSDGVPHPPATVDDVALLPGVTDACRMLRDAGFLLVCVTNQPDIARGTVSADEVARINASLREQLGLDAVLVCPHDDGDGCDCRKPHPGLITSAAQTLSIDLAASVMVGDRWRDVEAGRRAGCRTVLIEHAYGERRTEQPDLVALSLLEAVPWILAASPGPAGRTQRRPGVTDPRQLRVHVYADGADRADISALAELPYVRGFTTNPTLMRSAGVADYEAFARDVLEVVGDRPISFEVFADEAAEMERQASRIAGWGGNVFVKVPVTDTHGARSDGVIGRLAEQGVKLNVTALMTAAQVAWVSESLAGGPECFISVFAGRIADTGRDPIPIMRESLEIMSAHPTQRLIWASPRELLNVIQADEIGCHVITVTRDILTKLASLGKDLDEFSLETVQMFHRDAGAAGYHL